jgi:hypothetical protein
MKWSAFSTILCAINSSFQSLCLSDFQPNALLSFINLLTIPIHRPPCSPVSLVISSALPFRFEETNFIGMVSPILLALGLINLCLGEIVEVYPNNSRVSTTPNGM